MNICTYFQWRAPQLLPRCLPPQGRTANLTHPAQPTAPRVKCGGRRGVSTTITTTTIAWAVTITPITVTRHRHGTTTCTAITTTTIQAIQTAVGGPQGYTSRVTCRRVRVARGHAPQPRPAATPSRCIPTPGVATRTVWPPVPQSCGLHVLR